VLETKTVDGEVASELTGAVTAEDVLRLLTTRATRLTVNSGSVADLAFLARLPLRELDLVSVAPGTPITPVNFLTGLVRLNLATAYGGTLNLAGMTALERCFLEWGKGSESVAECPNLQYLYVNRYPGTDVSVFAGLPRLGALRIGNARRLVSVSALSGLALRGVGLYYCTKLTSVAGVSTEALVKLDANTCKAVNDWEGVADSDSLRYVGLQNLGPVPSIRAFQACGKLEFLWFPESTDVSDGGVAWLAEVPTLRKTGFQNRRHYDATREEIGEQIAARHGTDTWYPPPWEAL
jgi:hypothetical protein